MSAEFDRDDMHADEAHADDAHANKAHANKAHASHVDDAPAEVVTDWSALTPPTAEELMVVVGPTATGKTELAVRLAERFGGEVISADSVQIYREFDVGSGKPSAEERARAPHHLVDALDPHDAADAQRFAQMAGEAIADIRGRGRTPIVCGGTFLWVKALVWGLAPAPPGDEGIRLRHRTFAEREGRPALHAQLAVVDPESAARLAPNDMVRVSRALEIYELTGKPQSVWHAAHGFQERRHAARLVGVHRKRDDLDRRIHRRIREFLSHGWVEEVRGLLTRGYGGTRAMGSVGYKQVREHVEGRLSAGALEEAAVRATRVFVRRQRTWLRDLDVSYVGI